MAGNSFGQAFRISTFGESHGIGIGVVIDGCPAGLEIDLGIHPTRIEPTHALDKVKSHLLEMKPIKSKC